MPTWSSLRISLSPCRVLFDNPQTAYTRELVEAVPHIGGASAAAVV
jgi:hypothetical protein